MDIWPIDSRQDSECSTPFFSCYGSQWLQPAYRIACENHQYSSHWPSSDCTWNWCWIDLVRELSRSLCTVPTFTLNHRSFYISSFSLPYLTNLSVHTTISNIAFLQVRYLSVHSFQWSASTLRAPYRFHTCCKNNNETTRYIVQSQWMTPTSDVVACIRGIRYVNATWLFHGHGWQKGNPFSVNRWVSAPESLCAISF